MTNEQKNQIVGIVIEKEWYQNLVQFIQKAYQIDDQTLGILANGCKPTVTEQGKQNILTQLGLVETPKAEPVAPENPVENQPEVKEKKKN